MLRTLARISTSVFLGFFAIISYGIGLVWAAVLFGLISIIYLIRTFIIELKS